MANLRLRCCVDPPRVLFERLLPPNALAEWASLWVFPKDGRFDANELQAVSDGFVGRRMALWHIANTASFPDDLREKYGAFASRHQMIGEFISRCTMLSGPNILEIDDLYNKSISSDIAWANSGALTVVAEFLRRSRLGSNSALAFLCPDAQQPILWARLAQSLGCHNLTSRTAKKLQQFSAPEAIMKLGNRSLDYQAFVVSICASAGIITCMQCEDSDTAPALVFWGQKEEIATAGSRLVGLSDGSGEDDLKRWLSRGAQFVV
jgi:hypothetical protein